jgi:predicted transposase/invertase (TIGR01784 family)
MENKKINNPHDKFIKTILNNKKNATSFLRNYLPKDIVKMINFKTLVIDKDSFVEEKLKEIYSDLLFKVQIKNKSAYIFLLFEHKSKADEWVGLQLLKYILAIWERERANNKGIKKLPMIIPYVFYHGKEDWKYETNLSSIIKYEDEFKEYIPNFKYILGNMGNYADEEITGTEVIKAAILLMKHIFDNDINKAVAKIIEYKMLTIEALGEKYYKIMITYLIQNQNLDIKKTVNKLKNQKHEEEANKMITTAQRLLAEGEIKGEKKGEKKGLFKVAKRMFKKGLDIKLITEVTGLPKKELKLCK